MFSITLDRLPRKENFLAGSFVVGCRKPYITRRTIVGKKNRFSRGGSDWVSWKNGKGQYNEKGISGPFSDEHRFVDPYKGRTGTKFGKYKKPDPRNGSDG